jgi:hypothetical protein
VLVSASNLPADQAGEVRLHSTVQTFPVRADSNGNVRLYITVPRDAGIGGHTVQVCWASTCRLTATLQVLEPVAPVTPTPVTTPSPGATSSPSPVAPASLSLSRAIVKAGGSLTVFGSRFPADSTAVVSFVQVPTDQQVASHAIGSDGTFQATFNVPASAVPGTATIRACARSVCGYATFQVTAA